MSSQRSAKIGRRSLLKTSAAMLGGSMFGGALFGAGKPMPTPSREFKMSTRIPALRN